MGAFVYGVPVKLYRKTSVRDELGNKTFSSAVELNAITASSEEIVQGDGGETSVDILIVIFEGEVALSREDLISVIELSVEVKHRVTRIRYIRNNLNVVLNTRVICYPV